MQGNDFHFPQDIYVNHLTIVDGISFTRREIDVIACLLNARGTSKIASLLVLAPTTILTHIQNIMAKLGCNSREGIIDFIEKSQKLALIKKYYAKLIIHAAFEKSLTDVSKLKEREPFCLVIYWENQDHKDAFIHHLKYHLNLAGIEADIRDQKVRNKETDLRLLSTSVFVFLEKKEGEDIPQELSQVASIDLSDHTNYYFLVFEILRKILGKLDLEKIISEFKISYEGLEGSVSLTRPEAIAKEMEESKSNHKIGYILDRKIYFLSAFLVICILGIGFLTFMATKHKNASQNLVEERVNQKSIRSDLMIPAGSALLNRSELLTQIGEKFKHKDGIQTVALVGIVGMGGVGKTTIARQFARSYPSQIIWELNAETKMSLLTSFKELAYALAKTTEQKNDLDIIQKIQDTTEKEKQILLFVKHNLLNNPNWLLIYDNVESLSNIKNYFPIDPSIWGTGKVILTTRDSNIKNTNDIKPENVLQIEELNPTEALTLFSKILYNFDPDKLSPQQREDTLVFLKNIPPFPLDIATAAYYIKNAQITYDQYLERIMNDSKAFEIAQKSFLKEASDYTKTRYGIITLSFEKLIDSRPEFKELLLLVCLLDSQQIPRVFLEQYEEASIVDQFFHNLKKYSLITAESSEKNKERMGSFSLHRSTQTLGKTYLLSLLNTTEKQHVLNKIIVSMKNFYEDYSKQNTQEIVSLIPHLEMLLDHLKDLSLTESVKSKYKLDLFYILGYSYYSGSKNFMAAKKYFDQILEDKTSNQHFSNLVLATLLRDLGNISIKLCDLNQKYSEKGIELCKKVPNSELIIAECLQSIGATYRKKDNFEKANQYLTQALEKILNVHMEKKQELESKIYNQLGWLYSVTFIHNDKSSKSQKYLLKSLDVLNASQLFHKNVEKQEKKLSCIVAENKCRLGLVNLRLGHYEEALNQGFREAEYIKAHSLDKCQNDVSIKGQIAEGFGELFLRQGHIDKAEQKLSEATKIFDVIVGKAPALVPNTLKVESKVRQGKLSEAYKECIELLGLNNREKNNFHNLIYLTNFYHAAIIKYKQGDLRKSIEHFNDFLREVKIFCKSFLDQNAYKELERQGLFSTATQDENLTQLVKEYLLRSTKIFSAIYAPSHPFVKDYVTQNEMR